jgi:hypothetical protein
VESDAKLAVEKLNKTDFQGRKMLIGASMALLCRLGAGVEANGLLLLDQTMLWRRASVADWRERPSLLMWRSLHQLRSR